MKPVNNLLGRRFGRLLVIERVTNPGTRKNDTAAYWNCQCECGKTSIIRGYSLTTNKTKSCGCLKLEAPHLAPFSLPKYTPEIAAAQKAWRSRYTDLPFEEFYKLAKMPCFYCGTLFCLEKRARQKDQSSTFKYNTLDRIDSSLGHTIDNVVPACMICNMAKLDRSFQDFENYIIRLCGNTNKISTQEYRKLTTLIDLSILSNEDKYSWFTSLKCTHSLYKDGDITLEQFYQLSSSNCYYCLAPPSNRRNMASKNSSKYAKATGTYIYNGLDRVDNNLPHNYENVVPACKYCNSAKNQLTMQEFDNWINRLIVQTSSLEYFYFF